MKIISTALAAALLSAGAVSAATVTVNFAGTTSFNPGEPGGGAFAGNIVYDTDAATFVGVGRHDNAVSAINFAINGTNIDLTSTPTSDVTNQVVLNGTPQTDATLTTVEGGFGPSGTAGINVESVFFELRFAEDVDIFDGIGNLFSELADGDTFDIGDIDFFSLVTRYGPGTDPSILRIGNLSSFSVNVVDVAPVPLPAGMPLMLAGLGAFGVMKRRKS